jgi:hypothetical protein
VAASAPWWKRGWCEWAWVVSRTQVPRAESDPSLPSRTRTIADNARRVAMRSCDYGTAAMATPVEVAITAAPARSVLADARGLRIRVQEPRVLGMSPSARAEARFPGRHQRPGSPDLCVRPLGLERTSDRSQGRWIRADQSSIRLPIPSLPVRISSQTRWALWSCLTALAPVDAGSPRVLRSGCAISPDSAIQRAPPAGTPSSDVSSAGLMPSDRHLPFGWSLLQTATQTCNDGLLNSIAAFPTGLG